MSKDSVIQQLVTAFRCLPGVGPKSAQRMTFFLLQRDRQGGHHLAHSLTEAMTRVGDIHNTAGMTTGRSVDSSIIARIVIGVVARRAVRPQDRHKRIPEWVTERPQLTGPVGIVRETKKAAERSWTDYLELLGILSAYLGGFNLVPFPALDGGRLLFLSYVAVTRRRPNARIEAHIHALGLLMLLTLIAVVSVFDITAK